MLTMRDQLPSLSKPMLLEDPQKYDLPQLELFVLPALPILLTSFWDGIVGNMLTSLVGTMEILLCPVKLPTVASKHVFLQII